MVKIIDKLLGTDKDNEEKDAIKDHRNFLKEQQIVDVSTANEQLDAIQQDQRSDLLKWQQDLEDEMTRLKHRLKSEMKYDDGSWGPKLIPVAKDEKGKIIYDRVPPLANELFIDYIETQAEPFLSRNLFSSNLKEKQIYDILRNTCDDIADSMADSWDKFDIEFINYDIIVRLIKNVIIPGPFRALNDGQRRHDRTIAKRIEAFNERPVDKTKAKTLMGVDL